MSMARHNAAELWGHAQTGIAIAPGEAKPARGGSGVMGWAERAPVGGGMMVVGGLALAAVGALGAWVLPVGFVGSVILGTMFTIGGGSAFLGAHKLRAGRGMAALPPATTETSEAVLIERARRVHAILDRGGDFTFEVLMAELRWTERALVETLVYMKDRGTLVEDLDLDSGQWVYRAQMTDYGQGRAMTLQDRQAQHAALAEREH